MPKIPPTDDGPPLDERDVRYKMRGDRNNDQLGQGSSSYRKESIDGMSNT